MVLDKPEDVLHIATSDYELIKGALNKFNSIYKTDLTYLDSIDIDGVMFSYVCTKGANIDKVFLFGAYCGVLEYKRNQEGDSGPIWEKSETELKGS
ncbi:MAG: hypothetical protein K6L80_13895 [Agarilytica sp.]